MDLHVSFLQYEPIDRFSRRSSGSVDVGLSCGLGQHSGDPFIARYDIKANQTTEIVHRMHAIRLVIFEDVVAFNRKRSGTSLRNQAS